MVQPSGSVTTSNFGYKITTTDTVDYLAVFFFLREQPIQWQNAPPDRHRKHNLFLSRNVDVTNAADKLKETYYFQRGGGGASLMVESNDTSDWTDTKTISNHYIRAKPFLCANFAQDEADYPHYIYGLIRLERTGANDVIYYNGLFLEEKNDQSYTGPDANALWGEKICKVSSLKMRTTSSNSADAHLLMEGMCHTYNALAYQSRWAMSTPCFVAKPS